MDSWIEGFCINNDLPPDKVVQEVKNILVKPLQDLKDLDVEILTLERHLEELKAKRKDIQQSISRYQFILSPIRRLPGDVLGEIFERCLSFHTNAILKETESPLLLTRVCKLWRGVALSEPRLWSRIHITFTEPQPDWNFANSIHRDQAVLQRRLDALKEWLSHAGTRPLSISIHFVEAGIRPEISPVTMELLRFLARLSPRFEDLELTMPLETYCQLESMMDVPQMTNLKYLRILSLPWRSGSNIKPLLILKAPTLRQVFTFGCDPALWGIMDPSYSSVWSRLTNISCYTWFSKREIITLLEHTPNLVHLAVTVSDPSSAQGVVSISHPGNISLLFLRTLFLVDAMSSHHRSDLYERIDAPGLKWVMFTPSTTSSDDNNFSSSRPIPIIPLLRRATGLKKLSFNPLYIEAWDIRGLFRVVPSITHLFIGSESRAANGSIQRVKHPLNMWVRSKRFNFHLLSSSDNPPLLPNLQSFEINSQVIIVDPEDLLRFIKYRMAPLAGSGVSVLKHIAVVFYWTQRRVLDEEIRQHAELVGVEMIDLILDYVKPPEEKTNVPVPEFGLMKLEVPLGNHADVDNYIRFHRLSDSQIF